MVEAQTIGVHDLAPIDKNILLPSLSLPERLDIVVQANPQQYSHESIDRVKALVQYQDDNPDKKTPYRMLSEVDDYALYYRLNPEWQGKSIGEIKKDLESGGNAFYIGLTRLLRRTGKSLEDRTALMNQIFIYQRRDRSKFLTLEDWKAEFDSHMKWQGRSVSEMEEDQESGAAAFYKAYRKWTRVNTTDPTEQDKLMKEMFERKKPRTKWNYFESIDQWIEEYQQHAEWQGRTPKEMILDQEGDGSAFYQAFIKWVRKNSKTPRERRLLTANIFKRRTKDWISFGSIDDWIAEYNKHPEWQREKPHALVRRDKEGGSFYTAFLGWVNKTAKTPEEKLIYKRAIFPDANIRVSKKLTIEPINQAISSDEALEDIMKLL